jgi:hypothetical protein
MITRFPVRLYGVLAAALLSLAAPASAQFTPRTLNDPATGEQFHIEGSAGFWSPAAGLVIRSAGLCCLGSAIDLKKDLGLTDQRFNELHLVLRPARKHKFRLDYIPINYSEDTHAVSRDVIFSGQRYTLGVPVTWQVDWKAYRFGYEYDFITKNRGFAGLILEAKYTKLKMSLRTPLRADADTFGVRGPLPSFGGIGRGYLTPNISITGEVTGISIPKALADIVKGSGSYVDYNFYGTVNVTNNVGGQIGYRAMDVNVTVPGLKGGAASALLKGLYFGIVARY